MLTVRRLLIKFVLLMVLLGFYSVGNCTPTISKLSGAFSEGQEFTIVGSSFGVTGPSIVLFDNFEGGTTGSEIPLTSPMIGTGWTTYGTNHPTYADTAHSGTRSMSIAGNSVMQQVSKQFTGTTEIFMSHWMRIPTGTNFPGTATPNTMSTMSSWKLIWPMDTDQGYHLDDNIYLGWTGGGWGLYSNNDTASWYLSSPVGIANGAAWWTFNGWMRVSWWLKAGANPKVDAGSSYLQLLKEGVGAVVQSGPTRRAPYDAQAGNMTAGPLFGTNNGVNDNHIPQFDRVNVPGWIYVTNANTRPVYDDIYIATGVNAQARVEIGDNQVYASCKKLCLLIPTNWSDNQLNVKVITTSFAAGESAYLFVIDGNGLVNSNGYPVKIGDTYKQIAAPKNVQATPGK